MIIYLYPTPYAIVCIGPPIFRILWENGDTQIIKSVQYLIGKIF